MAFDVSSKKATTHQLLVKTYVKRLEVKLRVFGPAKDDFVPEISVSRHIVDLVSDNDILLFMLE